MPRRFRSDDLPFGLLTQVVDHVSNGVVVLDERCRIVVWNEWMFLRADGTEAPLGRSFFDWFPQAEESRLGEAIGRALREGASSLLSPRLNRVAPPLFGYPRGEKPSALAVSTLVRSLHVEGKRFCLLEFVDQTPMRKREQRLRDRNAELSESAYRDALTGVSNRRRLDEFLAIEFRRAQRMHDALAVAMIDVDHFKDYNDHYGHQAGDLCLKHIAALLQETCHRAGDLVARYGGEEFIAVLPGTDINGAGALAEAIRQQVFNLGIPHEASKVANCVTVSIGVACAQPARNDKVETLVSAADFALYRAKAAGRNRVVSFGRDRA